jgi:hypothetical protein
LVGVGGTGVGATVGVGGATVGVGATAGPQAASVRAKMVRRIHNVRFMVAS